MTAIEKFLPILSLIKKKTKQTKTKKTSAFANVTRLTDWVSESDMESYRGPYIKLTQMLLCCDSVKLPIRYIKWQYVKQWTGCLNETDVLRGIFYQFGLPQLSH